MKIKSAILLIITIFTTLPFTLRANSLSGEWVHHPSIDIYSSTGGFASQSTNNVQKLIAGERYLYALITSSYYYGNLVSNSTAHAKTPINIARLDLNNPAAVMEPLLPKLPLSGFGVVTAEYCYEKGCIAIAYENACIDIIFDDGRIVSNKDMEGMTSIGGKKANSISFTADGSKIVAATGFGIVVIDSETGHTEEFYDFHHSVDFANIVGEKMIVASDDAIRCFPLGSRPMRISDIPMLKADTASTNQYILNSEGGVKLQYGIYPIDERSFAFIGSCYNLNSYDGVSLNVLTIPENPAEELCDVNMWHSTYVNLKTMAATEPFVKGYREQGIVSKTRTGLMIHTEERIELFDYKGITFNYEIPGVVKNYITNNFKTHYKDPVAYTDVQAGQEKFKICASVDGENFYIFRPRQGFQLRKAVSTDLTAKKTVWESTGDVYGINGCTAGVATYLYYTPEYGLTVHNRGRDNDGDYASGMFDGLCTYRNGEWTQRSLAHRNYSSGYMYSNSQVATTPNGGIQDPNDPKYIYTRGRLSGLRRENLEDANDHLLLTTSKYKTNLPFRYPVVEYMEGSAYPQSVAFSEPGFDSDGTMWLTFERLVHPAYPEEHAELWYWTAEDRAACKTAADYESHPMKVINLPGLIPSSYGITSAAKMECNRNLILHASGNGKYSSFIYDNNGTLEDTSDDRAVELKEMLDEMGNEILSFNSIQEIFEDSYDGAFIIPHYLGVITMTREGAFSGDKPRFSWLRPILQSTGSHMIDFGYGGIAGITIDREGHKWMALKHGGLVCLSPDRSTILAQFTTANSSLPTDELLAVKYNPESNSIFVSTIYGLSELVLAGNDHQFITLTAGVSPRIVEAHYKGYVTFSGIADSEVLTLIGPNGAEIPLGQPKDGILQWHPQGAPSGVYRLKEHPEVEVYVN